MHIVPSGAQAGRLRDGGKSAFRSMAVDASIAESAAEFALSALLLPQREHQQPTCAGLNGRDRSGIMPFATAAANASILARHDASS